MHRSLGSVQPVSVISLFFKTAQRSFGQLEKALELAAESPDLRKRLQENTLYFRDAMKKAGFTIKEGTHPIVPIMLGDAVLAQKMAANLLEKGIYVTGFYYPVVPKGEARIRTQISAAHTRADLEFAVQAFIQAKKEVGV